MPTGKSESDCEPKPSVWLCRFCSYRFQGEGGRCSICGAACELIERGDDLPGPDQAAQGGGGGESRPARGPSIAEDLPEPGDGRHCGTCRHWLPLAMGIDLRAVGECRLYAPVAPVEGCRADGRWPQTTAQDWCGEYSPIKLASKPSRSDETLASSKCWRCARALPGSPVGSICEQCALELFGKAAAESEKGPVANAEESE